MKPLLGFRGGLLLARIACLVGFCSRMPSWSKFLRSTCLQKIQMMMLDPLTLKEFGWVLFKKLMKSPPKQVWLSDIFPFPFLFSFEATWDLSISYLGPFFQPFLRWKLEIESESQPMRTVPPAPGCEWTSHLQGMLFVPEVQGGWIFGCHFWWEFLECEFIFGGFLKIAGTRYPKMDGL